SLFSFSSLITRHPPTSTLFPYTTLFRSLPNGRNSLPKKLPERSPGRHVTAHTRNILLRDVRGRQTTCRKCRSDSGCEQNVPRVRSEEHTSELQSRFDLVCRLLLEKKKK